MHRTENVNENKHCRHLKLVHNQSTLASTSRPGLVADNLVDKRDINHSTVAMMNRLWIPQSSSIVGLLGVGQSKDNFDELSKWIEIQLSSTMHGCDASNLEQLEKRFLRAVDEYPQI